MLSLRSGSTKRKMRTTILSFCFYYFHLVDIFPIVIIFPFFRAVYVDGNFVLYNMYTLVYAGMTGISYHCPTH